jgi:hypothetical protein
MTSVGFMGAANDSWRDLRCVYRIRLQYQTQGARPFGHRYAFEKRPERRSRRGKQRVRLTGQPVGQKPDPFTDDEIEHKNSVGHMWG